MGNADYRKHNDGSLNSSTYHKKDGTKVRAILKRETEKEVEMETNCARCNVSFIDGKVSSIMSRFNLDIICSHCESKEKLHPAYHEAQLAELKAVQNGDYNFPGIGKPADL